jgi:uncharacterized protein involved in exopolysaccharide biosynthesis
MKRSFTLLDVIQLLVDRRKYIAGVTAGVMILSAGLSLLQPDYFKASTTFYAASQDLLNPDKIFGKSTNEMYYFGNAYDIDRILSIGASAELIEHMIDEFGLYDHYEIDPEKPKAADKAKKRFSKHYTIQKTKLDAVEITFEDTSPELAAQIANRAREVIDSLSIRMIKSRQYDVIKSFEMSIDTREALLQNLRDSLIELRGFYNIYNSEIQGEILSTSLMSTENALNKEKEMLAELENSRNIRKDTIAFIRARVRGLEKQLENMLDTTENNRLSVSKFNQGKNLIQTLETQYNQAAGQLSWDRVRLGQLETVYESGTSTIHPVELAEVPNIKSRPKRSLLVLGSGILAFAFAVLGALLYDSYLSLKDKIEWDHENK